MSINRYGQKHFYFGNDGRNSKMMEEDQGEYVKYEDYKELEDGYEELDAIRRQMFSDILILKDTLRDKDAEIEDLKLDLKVSQRENQKHERERDQEYQESSHRSSW